MSEVVLLAPGHLMTRPVSNRACELDPAQLLTYVLITVISSGASGTALYTAATLRPRSASRSSKASLVNSPRERRAEVDADDESVRGRAADHLLDGMP